MSNVTERTGAGKFAKFAFIAFNVAMLIWVIYLYGINPEGAGDAMFHKLGETIVLGIWAIGAAVLGLATYLTRPK